MFQASGTERLKECETEQGNFGIRGNCLNGVVGPNHILGTVPCSRQPKTKDNINLYPVELSSVDRNSFPVSVYFACAFNLGIN